MTGKEKSREQYLKDFVEKVDAMKKANPKDLSSDQDLSIGIMNLIAIEEHLAFTGAKTEKTHYYDIIPEIHQMRRGLLEKIIKQYEGEVWCTSKHLLSACMRLMEVGTKQMDMGNNQEAYGFFDKAYELYCLFWGLNMNAINLADVKWVKDTGMSAEEIRRHVANMKSDAVPQAAEPAAHGTKTESKGFMSRLKETVKKAVNCCIE
jgi:hypothetical protein